MLLNSGWCCWICLQKICKMPSKTAKICKNLQIIMPAQYQISTNKEPSKVLYSCDKIAKSLYLSYFLIAYFESCLRRHENIAKSLNKAVFCYSFAKPFAKLYLHKKSSLHGWPLFYLPVHTFMCVWENRHLAFSNCKFNSRTWGRKANPVYIINKKIPTKVGQIILIIEFIDTQ